MELVLLLPAGHHVLRSKLLPVDLPGVRSQGLLEPGSAWTILPMTNGTSRYPQLPRSP